MQSRLPNLIIAGVNKAGTTSLYNYLVQHPAVCASSIKETFYFDAITYGEKLPPLEQYRSYFEHCGEHEIIIESTPRYIYGGEALATAIKETLSEVKLIFILRDPVQRIFSFYKFKKRSLLIDKASNFSDFLQKCNSTPMEEKLSKEGRDLYAVEEGYYVNYLKEWFAVFEDKNIRICFFDELNVDPNGLLNGLGSWLGIDSNGFDGIDLSAENRSIDYKNQWLHKLILGSYRSAESFWNRNPRIRAMIAKVYYGINGRPFEEKINESDKLALLSTYAPYNKELYEFLIARGYSDLPKWLSETVQVS